jgi:hypothetical protein
MQNQKNKILNWICYAAAPILFILAIMSFIRSDVLRGISLVSLGFSLLIGLYPSKKAESIAIILALIFAAIYISS